MKLLNMEVVGSKRKGKWSREIELSSVEGIKG